MAYGDDLRFGDKRRSSLNNEPVGALYCFFSHLFYFSGEGVLILFLICRMAGEPWPVKKPLVDRNHILGSLLAF